VEDHHAGPAEIAATRIDFGQWLNTLGSRRRRIAQVLATGETTSRVARQFRISPARVSQLRSELRAAWHAFQGEELAVA
jgi:FixJ family two-component response regulator